MRRTSHERKVEVAMRAAAAPVDERGFRREFGLVD